MPNLDLIRKGLIGARMLPALTGLVGEGRVADSLYQLEKLVKQVHESSVIVASTTWAVVEGNKDPTKDKPISVASSKVGSYKELTADKNIILELIKDRALIDSESRKIDAGARYLPAVLAQKTGEFIVATGRFSCAFDLSVWSQLCQGDTSLEEHQQSLTRLLGHPLYTTISVHTMVEWLGVIRDRMARAVRQAIQLGNEQSKLMRKAKPPVDNNASEFAKILSAVLSDGRGLQMKKLKGGKGKDMLDDEAKAAFQHNPNPAQEAAAAAAQNAAGRRAKNREKLEAMPEDKELRKKILHDTICKFFWEPNLNCTRNNCRFVHMTPDETKALGISDAEVKAALH